MTNDEIIKKVEDTYFHIDYQLLNRTKAQRKKLLEFFLSDMYVWYDYFVDNNSFSKKFHLFDIAKTYNQNWSIQEVDETVINGVANLFPVDKILLKNWLNWNLHRREIMEQTSIFCDPFIHLDCMLEFGGWLFRVDGSGAISTYTSAVNPRLRTSLARYTGAYPR